MPSFGIWRVSRPSLGLGTRNSVTPWAALSGLSDVRAIRNR